MRRTGSVVLACCALVVAACSDDRMIDSAAAPVEFEVEPIDWSEYSPGFDTALVEVPVDYSEPDGETIELFVARRRASDPAARIGSLLVNPGGPGFGGTDLVAAADDKYDEDLLSRFDIVGWDPRGTGSSDRPIECSQDVDRYVAEVPLVAVDEARRQLAVDRNRELTDLCMSKNPIMWSKVGTNNSARDMDVIRRALGEDTISYFGFSYGSTLGAAWVTLFPDTVRAAVLDGAADPDQERDDLRTVEGFERALDTFLEWCGSRTECAFHRGDRTAEAFDDLMNRIETDPVPTVPGRSSATRSMAKWAVTSSLYLESSWPELGEALEQLDSGDGTGVLALYDDYFQRQPDGSYGPEMDAHRVITCADQRARVDVAEADALMVRQSDVAPRIQPPGSVGDYYCTFFPTAEDPLVTITGEGAGPILVVGTTGDPATPLDASRAMADSLEDGRLVIVDADQHTGYGVNDCIDDVVGLYLIDLVVPADGIECR